MPEKSFAERCYHFYMAKRPMPESEEEWNPEAERSSLPARRSLGAGGRGREDASEEFWKKKLTPEQYRVLRKKGTEMAFTGEYVHEKADGTYACAACGNPLFTSDAKFDSGTGWPSFDQALPGAIETDQDTSQGMTRTEIMCARCGSHLGHVFDDGPTKTGKRYCINSVCLDLEQK